ncbi:Hypothetical predicted protein [Lecanosticta acicola]|uniref:T6SS Phospholipase effector Tle1-like catalytic domain-containing protein n=1 Tax=Lecanosticta acicola TaxID=111012 RepID=A0AAI8YUW9_9PEZI|nr:Hypothetical predicted protein [Lecanosticta acicola]
MNRNSWTPHSYPVQAPPEQSFHAPVKLPPKNSFSSFKTTAETADMEDFDPDAPIPPNPLPPKPVPQLPRNMRAVRDGINHKSQGRTIIICLDGTGDKFDGDNSNIVHFVSCLKKSYPNQITYYQSGIGTYNGGGLTNGVNAAFDMAVGSGLGVHIRDAYKFLMQNYQENDKICLFGFSRGAYTARCLAGMLHKVGLLPAHNVSQVQFAYEYYKDDTVNGWKMSADFKRTFCMNINVYFIGVFDSVASVGFIPRTLPLSSTPTNKSRYFRHAMALDEHRAKFKVCRFQRKDHIDNDAKWKTAAELHERPDALVRRFSPGLGLNEKPETNGVNGVLPNEKKAAHDDIVAESMQQAEKRQEQQWDTDVLEVWFAGCHCDVGGGAVKNEERHRLAQIPLRWMIRQCFECNTEIIFKAHVLAEEGIDVHTLYPQYQSLEIPSVRPPPHMMDKFEKGEVPSIKKRSSVLEPVKKEEPHGFQNIKLWQDSERQLLAEHWVPEQVEDYFDALTSINDQLATAKGWWVLEVWPVEIRYQPKDADDWRKKTGMNLGRFRAVQEYAPNLHWTVQARQEAKGYKIRTRLDRKSEWKLVV